jgi:hypothetical protein
MNRKLLCSDKVICQGCPPGGIWAACSLLVGFVQPTRTVVSNSFLFWSHLQLHGLRIITLMVDEVKPIFPQSSMFKKEMKDSATEKKIQILNVNVRFYGTAFGYFPILMLYIATKMKTC